MRMAKPDVHLTRVTLGVAVALLAVGAALGWGTAQLIGPASAPASSAALDAARRDVVDLMSYDYRTIDSDLSTALSHTVGGFHDTMASAMQAHRTTFVRLRSVSTATVTAAAVESATSSSATVLLFVDQTVRNSRTAGAETDHTRVVVTMTRSGGAWLVSDLELT
ncbi:MAG TPA: hypothetical protein VN088_11220 [Nocardioides sp.]|nr:hypothetical protein [Nocardioides sp.]